MFQLAMGVDERIHDLQVIADELRFERNAPKPPRRPGWLRALRLRVGRTFLAAGEALVSGAAPATISRAGR